MNILVSLSPADKRVIFFLLLLLIVALLILAYLGYLIKRIMIYQGKKVDEMTHAAVMNKVIVNKQHFLRYANKKNWILFFKQSYIPLLIILFGVLVLIIRNIATQDFAYNVFDYKKTGFSTLLFLWDFSNPDNYTKVFFLTLLAKWPDLLNIPHFEIEAWASYIFVPCVFVGGIWYLVSVQRVLARKIRIIKLSKSLFKKDLENVNLVDNSLNNDNNMNADN